MSILSSILSLFSLNSCNDKSEKIYKGTSEFKIIEKKLSIKEKQAIIIYDSNFSKNFLGENQTIIDSNFWKYMYIYEKNYYVGYIHKYDKKGIKQGTEYFTAKINSETGEISVVK
jgi:hypothetical protein